MTGESRWARVRDLFERALDVEPAQLDAWFDREAAGDAELAAEVRSLLSHHTQAGSFLADPLADRLPELMLDEARLEPGQMLGPYTIDREIGRGGMGRVYLAHDNRLGRVVALKALSSALTPDPAHRARLRREARAAAALAHPGICTIFALEEFDDELFIAAEYVDGHTLRHEIDTGPPRSPAQVAAVARQIAAALAHAHGRGVTHRDLKPENVMRAADGTLKILDFGLAIVDQPATGGDARVTQPGTVLGTPAYMAPEQINGGPVDARVDVFAWGVLLYEYACGSHPFAASTPLATIARVLESQATPIGERRADLPPALGSVIDRCLRKTSSERFASGQEILRALAAGAPAASRHVTAWWRAHQAITIALYFVACLAAWQVKEWLPGLATALFVVAGITATVAGVFRGHLLFAERVNRSRFPAELRRARAVTAAADGFLAAILAVDGLFIAMTQPLTGVLVIALGVGIALGRLLVEPATTDAAFAPGPPGPRLESH